MHPSRQHALINSAAVDSLRTAKRTLSKYGLSIATDDRKDAIERHSQKLWQASMCIIEAYEAKGVTES